MICIYDSEDVTSEGEIDPDTKRMTIRLVSGTPLSSHDNLTDAVSAAKLWLFDNPRKTALLFQNGLQIQYLRLSILDEWIDKHCKWMVVLAVHILLLSLYVIASGFHDYGWIGVAGQIGLAGLYQLVWRLGILNEVEGGVLCTIINILVLLLTSSIQRGGD